MTDGQVIASFGVHQSDVEQVRCHLDRMGIARLFRALLSLRPDRSDDAVQDVRRKDERDRDTNSRGI
jgi:hypothetical protein